MKDRTPAVDAHAYVDECLTPEERGDFEVRLRQDVDLRRRVELWQAQNEAIRATFGASARNASRSPDDSRSGASRLIFANVAARGRGDPAEPGSRQIPPSAGAQARLERTYRPRRVTTFAAFVLIGVTLFPGAMAYPPPSAFGDAAASAFRAFSPSSIAALDFRGVGAEGLSNFLGPAFLAARLPEWIVPWGWRLRGAKRVPGLEGEAVLVLLDGAENRDLGVLVEPLDAPASSAIRSESRNGLTTAEFTRRGYGVVVVSPSADGTRAWLSASGFLDGGWPHPIR